jgi:hypothetical protein
MQKKKIEAEQNNIHNLIYWRRDLVGKREGGRVCCGFGKLSMKVE